MSIDSEAEKKLREARDILQEWMNKQSHDRCWYYPDVFRQLADVLGVTRSANPGLPPLHEFKKGCERYQQEEYGNSYKP